MAWIGVRPGDVHLAISSPGWAKHAWSCFFAPWIAEATIFVYNYAPVRRGRAAASDPPGRRHHVLRATDGVAHADPGRPRRAAGGAARDPRRGRAAQPRRHRAGREGVGADHPRRLRPDRDDAAGRQHPGPAASRRARWAGRCPACRWCWSTPSRASSPTRARSASTSSEPPVNLMTGYLGDAGAQRRGDGRRLLPHRRRRQPRRGRLHHLHRPHRRRVQVLATTRCRRSSWRAC